MRRRSDHLLIAVEQRSLSHVNYYVQKPHSTDIMLRSQIVAAQNGDLEILKCLIAGNSVKQVFNKHILESAATYGKLDLVKYLLDAHGKFFNVECLQEIFSKIVCCDQIDVAKYFLEKKLVTHPENHYLQSIRSKDSRMINFFYEIGYEPNFKLMEKFLINSSYVVSCIKNLRYLVHVGWSIDSEEYWCDLLPKMYAYSNYYYGNISVLIACFYNYLSRKQKMIFWSNCFDPKTTDCDISKIALQENHQVTFNSVHKKANIFKIILKPMSLHMQLTSIE
jgi:hypothetical protein